MCRDQEFNVHRIPVIEHLDKEAHKEEEQYELKVCHSIFELLKLQGDQETEGRHHQGNGRYGQDHINELVRHEHKAEGQQGSGIITPVKP